MSIRVTKEKLRLLAKLKGVPIEKLKCEYCIIKKAGPECDRSDADKRARLRKWGRYVCENFEDTEEWVKRHQIN